MFEFAIGILFGFIAGGATIAVFAGRLFGRQLKQAIAAGLISPEIAARLLDYR